jgi:uncharacterized protein (TIGR02118 family)
MAGAKIVVLYPQPKDINEFERAYTEDHVPMVNAEKMAGLTKFVATKFVGTPTGDRPPFHRMAELYFTSIQTLQECAQTEHTQKAVEHAVSISSGGAPLFIIAEEEIKTF